MLQELKLFGFFSGLLQKAKDFANCLFSVQSRFDNKAQVIRRSQELSAKTTRSRNNKRRGFHKVPQYKYNVSPDQRNERAQNDIMRRLEKACD